MVLDYLVFKEDLFAVKGAPNPSPRQKPSISPLGFSKPVELPLKQFWTTIL
jgi:hypothetical protein